MNLEALPDDLPVPVDDGGADHLVGTQLPDLALPTTAGGAVRPRSVERLVLYVYPMTGRPDRQLPPDWEQIPGARGCTPQACAFRDHHAEIRALGAEVMGLSTQDTGYQREMVERLHLPFPVLSDHDLAFTTSLGLPTFEVAGMLLNRRLTMICRSGTIEHVMYPVFPPDRNPDDVMGWLSAHPT